MKGSLLIFALLTLASARAEEKTFMDKVSAEAKDLAVGVKRAVNSLEKEACESSKGKSKDTCEKNWKQDQVDSAKLRKDL